MARIIRGLIELLCYIGVSFLIFPFTWKSILVLVVMTIFGLLNYYEGMVRFDKRNNQ